MEKNKQRGSKWIILGARIFIAIASTHAILHYYNYSQLADSPAVYIIFGTIGYLFYLYNTNKNKKHNYLKGPGPGPEPQRLLPSDIQDKKKYRSRCYLLIFVYSGLCLLTYMTLHRADEDLETLQILLYNRKNFVEGVKALEAEAANGNSHTGQLQLSELKNWADSLTYHASAHYSQDRRYAASIIFTIDPDVEQYLLNGNTDLEGRPLYKTGLHIKDATKKTSIDLFDEVCPNGMQIDTIAWNLRSNIIYISESYPSTPNSCVYEYNPATKKFHSFAAGSFQRIIPNGEYKDYLVITTSDCAEGEGRYWYDIAVSPDGAIRISEPYFN